MSLASPSADRPSLVRRVRVPLIAIAVPVTLFVLLIIWDRFELPPEAVFPMFMAFQMSVPLVVLVVAVWFLFFSGLTVTAKAVGVLIVAGLVGTVVAITRRVEFTGRMGPVFVFRWQQDLGAELAERLQHASINSAVAPLTAADLAISPDDFPRYRGVAADGVAPVVPVPANWSSRPPEPLWRTPVGWACSGIAVAGKAAVTIEQRKDQEAIVCYDRTNGKELWSHAYPAQFKHSPMMGDGGPRSTPTIVDGDVYALGAMGNLVCLDGTNGKPRWSTNIIEDNGAKVAEWGMTSSPLIVRDLVVVNAGIDPNNNRHLAVVAYDRKTGKKAWAVGDHPAGYSSPLLAKLGGVEQIVLFDGGGVAGIDPKDGTELWRHPWKTFSEMNIIQPLILPGDRVFISSEGTNGSVLLEVKQSTSGWSVAPVWATRQLATRFANPVYYAGHIYGLHNGILCCLDATTGKRLWKGERFDSGQLLLTGSTLLVQTERTGELAAVSADPTEYRELGRTKVFGGSRTWNTPSLAGGRLYLRNHEEMVCLELAK
jgi:outer membrane protein assembly factor BamB